MKHETLYRASKRTFLTTDPMVHSFIAYDIEVEKSPWIDESDPKAVIATELALHDCTRMIHWDFSAWNLKELRRARAKAKKSKKLLEDFFEKLEEAFDVMEKDRKNEDA